MTAISTERAAAATTVLDTVAAIKTAGLTKRFGSRNAVDGIDLVVPPGAVFGFLGPNGCGKTTTIRMLLGLIAPSAGEIELFGQSMPGAIASCLPRVGAMIEGPGFYPYLSGQANLARIDACDPTANPKTRHERVDAALRRVGLDAARGKKFRQYSLGMKQRLGIAAALLQQRDLFVLDEPTNGLDPQGSREVRTLVRELAADGATVLISSHLLSEIELVASHVAIMSKGVILAQGPLETVLNRTARRLHVSSSLPLQAVAALNELGLNAEIASQGDIEADMNDVDVEKIGPALVAAAVPFSELRVSRPALEDLFVELTGSGFDVAG